MHREVRRHTVLQLVLPVLLHTLPVVAAVVIERIVLPILPVVPAVAAQLLRHQAAVELEVLLPALPVVAVQLIQHQAVVEAPLPIALLAAAVLLPIPPEVVEAVLPIQAAAVAVAEALHIAAAVREVPAAVAVEEDKKKSTSNELFV